MYAYRIVAALVLVISAQTYFATPPAEMGAERTAGNAGTSADLSAPPTAQSLDYSKVRATLQTMQSLLLQSKTELRNIARSRSTKRIKQSVDQVFESIWGQPSGILDGQAEVAVHGWKTHWQTTYSNFDSAYAARYGNEPPSITDPQALGIAGQGLSLRRYITHSIPSAWPQIERKPGSRATNSSVYELVSSLNNVIGWTRMDDGVTKAERQPRADLTYMWDAPKAFWLSSADTGWLYEVQAQATNILKTRYPRGNAGRRIAREHAMALIPLIDKCLSGLDADGDGIVSATMLEGGLKQALSTLPGSTSENKVTTIGLSQPSAPEPDDATPSAIQDTRS